MSNIFPLIRVTGVPLNASIPDLHDLRQEMAKVVAEEANTEPDEVIVHFIRTMQGSSRDVVIEVLGFRSGEGDPQKIANALGEVFGPMLTKPYLKDCRLRVMCSSSSLLAPSPDSVQMPTADNRSSFN